MIEIDSNLLKSAAKGDRKAFKAIYDYYGTFVWRIAFRMVNGSHDDAQQILQEVFIKIHNALKKFKFNAAFSTWIYRITYNESIAQLQQMRARNRKLVSFDESVFQQSEEAGSENDGLVKKILTSLSPLERFLLVAREVDGLSYEDLTVITDKKAGALRILLHRLKLKIKEGFLHEYQVRNLS